MNQWKFCPSLDCWCMEDVVYTDKAAVPQAQRLSVFAPKAYLSETGIIQERGACGRYTAQNAPVIFENNAAGYMEMPNTHPGEDRFFGSPYLAQGMVYVTCGCRGRSSRNEQGEYVGKAPMTIVDFKTAIRFLRHHRGVLPGDWNRLISVGFSAGGAMSALLAVSGDHPDYDPYLRENGAYMEESDAVYAAQIYCPIIDLEHADMAYEWQFGADPQSEESYAGPAEIMTPFKEAVSRKLSSMYVTYVNGLELTDPRTGEVLTLGEDGRSGSFYECVMRRLSDAAKLCGEQPPVDLDEDVLHRRRRMKACTAFDRLDEQSGENELFGNRAQNTAHFSLSVAKAVASVAEQFPEEAASLAEGWKHCSDEGFQTRLRLLNPLAYIRDPQGKKAVHYRIRVGADDADTAFSVSMTLAVMLQNAHLGTVDDALVWHQPHCEADLPGQIQAWIHQICRQ
ncbi:MAG: subtype B tannase [Clostridia bacterium]|nr:subtype B tannase [Clostridia bacterium]